MTDRMLWITLLFSICGLLDAYRDRHHHYHTFFLRKCCREGMLKAEDGQDCSLYLFTANRMCSIVSEQCCKTSLKVILCDKGIQMAQQQHACEMSFFEDDIPDVQSAMMCCDCCSLGLKVAKQEMDCDLLNLSLGDHCRNVALSCCKKNNTMEATTMPSVINTTRPKSCAVVRCSQLCVDGVCACHPGYKMQKDGANCTDINECLLETDNCTKEETCVNNNGSFVCLSGINCEPGFELTVNNTCKDINECALMTHTCGSDLLCTNTEGSFDCTPKEECAEGFIRDNKRACVDINECLVHPERCHPSQTCINIVGTFICRDDNDPCGPGYLTAVGHCEDIDECDTGHVCGFHRCLNTVGSYHCECKNGFTFNEMTLVCEDINECSNSSVQPCAQNCKNTEGSFKCSCSTGFNLAHNNRNCDDIDECATENHTCSTSETCLNIKGGFRCLYLHCPKKFERTEMKTKGDLSLTVRCVKDCQPEDMNCHAEPVHIITHSVLILPITEHLQEPKGIIILRTITPAQQDEPDPMEVFFAILNTDQYLSFDVVKHIEKGMIVGVVRQVKPIHSPKDIVLEVVMNYVKYGVVSYRNYVFIHVFVSKY